MTHFQAIFWKVIGNGYPSPIRHNIQKHNLDSLYHILIVQFRHINTKSQNVWRKNYCGSDFMKKIRMGR